VRQAHPVVAAAEPRFQLGLKDLIWTRLNDPDRTPPHWTGIVRAGQYVVFISDARSRAPRDQEGRPFCAPDGTETGQCAALCDDAIEAQRFAHDVAARHHELCCEIYDYEGKSKPPLTTIYDPSVRSRYVGAVHARRLSALGIVLMCFGGVFVAIDVRHDLAWIWGYVIGLKCLLLGGALTTRGFLERREFRDNPADRA